MTRLESDMTTLRRLFEPWLTVPHGTVIWPPEDSDANADFKRELIAKADKVLAAGDAALAGVSFQPPQFTDAEYDAIEQELPNDHDQDEYFELARACESVVQSLPRVAA